jgi:CheY-like chemotaxis protein
MNTPPGRTESSADAGGKLPTRRILLVDDSVDTAEMLAELLRFIGQDVRTAYDGPNALQIAAEYRPEIVLLDIGLPGLDGFEVARRLQQLPGMDKIVLIALTGYGQDEDRVRTREAGFHHHLVKPVTLKILEPLLLERPE